MTAFKLFTIETITDGVPEAEIFNDEAAAKAKREAHYVQLWAEHMDEPYPGDADEAHGILTGEAVADDELMWLTEHDATELFPVTLTGIRFHQLSTVFSLITVTKPNDIAVAVVGTHEALTAAAKSFLTEQWKIWYEVAPPEDMNPDDMLEALRNAGWPGQVIATQHQIAGNTTVEVKNSADFAPLEAPAPDPDAAWLPRTIAIPAASSADPEEMNEDRASWADRAVIAFQAITGTDRDDAISDLIANIMHLCRRDGIDFTDQLERAVQHYSAETTDTTL